MSKLPGLRTVMTMLRGRHKDRESARYWTAHNVTAHHRFASAAESLEYFDWRNSQYPGYIDLMPVSGFDGQAVLDFGCGPGHDLVGFAAHSTCAKLAGVDVSRSSVTEAASRLALHGSPATVTLLESGAPLPFPDATFDYVHSSGVLHHIDDPVPALREIRRVLKPGGEMRAMVYNCDSIWMHLKVAYLRTIKEGLYPELSLREQFARSTDGDDCPVARCYTRDEFAGVAQAGGFSAVFLGAAVSLIELQLLPHRFEALMDRRLPPESRRFLESIEFDEKMMPRAGGYRAGIDGVYHLRPLPGAPQLS